VTRRAIFDGERSPGTVVEPGDVGVVSRPRFSGFSLVASVAGSSDAPTGETVEVGGADGGARGGSVTVGPCSDAIRREPCRSVADLRSTVDKKEVSPVSELRVRPESHSRAHRGPSRIAERVAVSEGACRCGWSFVARALTLWYEGMF